jgi:hypothetical protein
MNMKKEQEARSKAVYWTVWRMGRILLCAVSLTLTACAPSDKGDQEATASQPDQQLEVPDHGGVLARVNGQPIYAQDLEVAISNILGAERGGMLDQSTRQKVLQSLVLNRGMAQAAQKELNTDEVAWIEAKSTAYRDQLLAKAYLRQHSEPTPVTQEMVRAYYEEHPEHFGGKVVRIYELLVEKEKSDASQRDQIVQRLREAAQQKDWQAYAAQLASQGYAIQFRGGEENEQLLNPGLLGLLRPLKRDQVSQVTYISGKAYIARIVSEEEKGARPLQDVSADIRKMLAPIQLKKAIRQVSDEVMASARVEYLQESTVTE